MTRLVIVCGLPAAGKTTLARRLEHALPAVRMCPDEWMAGLGIDLFDGTSRAGGGAVGAGARRRAPCAHTGGSAGYAARLERPDADERSRYDPPG